MAVAATPEYKLLVLIKSSLGYCASPCPGQMLGSHAGAPKLAPSPAHPQVKSRSKGRPAGCDTPSVARNSQDTIPTKYPVQFTFNRMRIHVLHAADAQTHATLLFFGDPGGCGCFGQS